MSRLIDADEFLEKMVFVWGTTKVAVMDLIDELPTIEPNLVINPDEVKRGDVTMIGTEIVVMHHDDYMEMMLKSAAVDDGSWERFIAEPCEDAISRREALKSDVLMFDSKSGIYWIPAHHIENLPSVAPSRRGGDWIDLFEEIGNTIDTIGDGQETEAFNRGIEACAEIVRRFFGLDMSKESGR